jgi:predicted nucleic acid-binding protein
MKVLFDTSALVTAVVDQLPNHEAALACYRRFAQPRRGGGSTAICSTHTIAECYATLTALPLGRRIQPTEATRLIEENFLRHLEVVPLSAADYKAAVARVTELDLRSGAVYDALHARCAERCDCDRIITYNIADFERLKPAGVAITTP